MQKGSTKTIGILFVIILVVLLIAHLVTLRNVRTEYSAKEAAMTQQIADMKQQVETLSMEKKVLGAKLELEGVRIEVVRNNFSTSRETAEAFHKMLVDGGCKKLDRLDPIFEELNTNLLKKKDTEALANLDEIYQIIFVDHPETEEEEAPAPEAS